MGTHLPENKKYQLTGFVLEGLSMSQAARQFGIPERTARDIFYSFAIKFFFCTEIEKFNIGKKTKKKEYQHAWRFK